MSIDRRLERTILAELGLRDARARRTRRVQPPARLLAERIHREHHDLLAHLQRVAAAVPRRFRPVAWLHHAREQMLGDGAFTVAGLTVEELAAIDLLAHVDPPWPGQTSLKRVRRIAQADGAAGHLARVVARAAINDRWAGRHPCGDDLAALTVLGHDPVKRWLAPR